MKYYHNLILAGYSTENTLNNFPLMLTGGLRLYQDDQAQTRLQQPSLLRNNRPSRSMLWNCPRLLRLLVSLLLISSVTVIAETFCATISNVTLHDPSGPQPQTGNANLLGVGFKQAWPRFPSTKNGRRTIRYCYVDEAARKALQCSHMRPAMTAWAEAIGPIANAENGHSVAWKEIMFKHESGRWQPRFCFKQGGNEWNDGVPQDALAIHFEQGATPQATVGYTWSGPAGRHKMILPENASVRQVIHEVSFGIATTNPPALMIADRSCPQHDSRTLPQRPRRSRRIQMREHPGLRKGFNKRDPRWRTRCQHPPVR
jgi:hypothetical protein